MANPQVTALQQQIATLQAQLTALSNAQQQLTADTATIATLQQQLAAAQAALTAEQTKEAADQTQIASLQAKVAADDAAIAALQAQLAPPATTPAPVTQPPAPSPLSTLAANTARNIGPYANTDPQFNAGQLSALNITDYSCLIADPKRNRMLQPGGAGHGPSQETDIRVLDMPTRTWSSLYPSTNVVDMTLANLDLDKGRYISTNHPTAGHGYNMVVIRGDKLLNFQARGMPDGLHIGPAMQNGTGPDNGTWGGRTRCYDFVTETWSYGKQGSELATPPVAPWYDASAACLDPVSQLVLIVGSNTWSGAGGVWLIDPDADTVTTLCDADVGGSPDLVYFPPNDRFYVLQSDGRVWEIAFNRATPTATTITPLVVTGTAPSVANGMICGFAYDDRNKVIGGNVMNGVFYAFDPLTRIWKGSLIDVEAGSSGVPSMVFHNLDFDPNSGLYVFLNTPPWNDTVNTPTTWEFCYDKTTAINAPAPILPVGTTLQSLLDKGGTVTLGPGTQSLGAEVNVAGTILTGNGSVITGGAEVDGKGILVVNQSATITGITFEGATDNDSNGAGIRQSQGSGQLNVSNCSFVRCQDGYLGNDNVAFDGCTFFFDGVGDGQTHAVYSSTGALLASANNCHFSGTKIGHHFKSRAAKSVLTACVMDAATESYSANFPNGGVVEISGCSITEGPNTDNPKMISMGEEGASLPAHSLTISDTTLTSSLPGSIGLYIDPALAAMPVTLTNVHFVGVTTPVMGGAVHYKGCTVNGAAIPDTP